MGQMGAGMRFSGLGLRPTLAAGCSARECQRVCVLGSIHQCVTAATTGPGVCLRSRCWQPARDGAWPHLVDRQQHTADVCSSLQLV